MTVLSDALSGPTFAQTGSEDSGYTRDAYAGSLPMDPSIQAFTTDSEGNQHLTADFTNAYWSQLPSVMIGGREFAAPSLTSIAANDTRGMFQSGARVNDPNYGWVTPSANIKENTSGFMGKLSEYAPSLIGALIALGMPAAIGAVGGAGAGLGTLGNSLFRAGGNALLGAGGTDSSLPATSNQPAASTPATTSTPSSGSSYPMSQLMNVLSNW